MHTHSNEAYDAAKDAVLSCTTNEEALKLSKQYDKSLMRFLPKQQRYYLYTVACRQANTFPLNYYDKNWDK